MSRTAMLADADADARVRSALDAARGIDGFGRDVDATLAWCVDIGAWAPRVGEGATAELWELLASTAALSVSAARMLEPHLDALTILAQAGIRTDGARTWGVFAAEAADARLDAAEVRGQWRLTGTKPWCSLARHLTHAVITATRADGERALFMVDLRDPGVRAHDGPWAARGLPHVVSDAVDFVDVPAVPVGDPGWYLRRPGFAWGGISVAACWWGGAVSIAERLLAPAASERADQLALVHLGRADTALWAGRAVLAEAAALVDGPAAPASTKLLAERVRGVVVAAAARVLAEADAALGPAPLVTDEGFAAQVADLHLYLRQHHADRDAARLGRLLVGEAGS